MLHELMKTWFEFVAGVGLPRGLRDDGAREHRRPHPVARSSCRRPPTGRSRAGSTSGASSSRAGSGSTFGSSLCYWFTYTVGRAFVARWGRYFLLPPARLELAERWLAQFALGGIFLARLLPVVRHLIGFPAGLDAGAVRARSSAITFVGSTLWCGDPRVLRRAHHRAPSGPPDGPRARSRTSLKDDLLWFVLLVVGLGAGWLFVKWFGCRARGDPATPEAP